MNEERLALMEHALDMILKFGVNEDPPIQSKFFTESVPELIRAYRTEQARVKELEDAMRPLLDVNALGFRTGNTMSYEDAMAAIEHARRVLGKERA